MEYHHGAKWNNDSCASVAGVADFNFQAFSSYGSTSAGSFMRVPAALLFMAHLA
jgi:hypothetical protein